jgi:hypothetical protein
LIYIIPTNIQKQLTPQQKFNHSKNYPHFSKRPFVLGARFVWRVHLGCFPPFQLPECCPDFNGVFAFGSRLSCFPLLYAIFVVFLLLAMLSGCGLF